MARGTSPTLGDVAARAEVSLATASRVLNGSDRTVREDLRERVMAAATQLEYLPNASAQTMVRGRSSVLGLLVHDIADPYFSAIAAGVAAGAHETGLVVVLGSTHADPDEEVGYVRTLRELRGHGLVLTGSRVDPDVAGDDLARELAAFERQGGRVVAITQPRLPVDTIVIDNRAGAASLAKALVAHGYRRFAVLAGPQQVQTARDRCEGFQCGLAQAGQNPALVVHGEFTRDGGYAAMRELIGQVEGLDCVFAVNDVMAVGALTACREDGVDVPGQLGLAGFDDVETLRDIHPTLTTVRLPLTDIGRQAFHLLAGEPPLLGTESSPDADTGTSPDEFGFGPVASSSGPGAFDARTGVGPRRVHVCGRVVMRDSTPPR